MAKHVDLEALVGQIGKKQRPAEPPAGRKTRTGTVGLTIHVPPEVREQLKIIAAQERTTVHRLVCSAVNEIFARRSMPEVAR